jgi:hypothetical protein|nr:MAG TPA: hypothetical protein [Caudoviricetes sp.]
MREIRVTDYFVTVFSELSKKSGAHHFLLCSL